MKTKISVKVALLLLVASGIMLSLSVVYYDFMDKAENYRYSDSLEYSNITEGLAFIKKLPIQFNITNQYFSGFDNLDESTRESIIMAYAIKNNYKTYSCGNSNTICIDKASLASGSLLQLFNSSTKFITNSIKAYLDNYGSYTINSSDKSTYFKVVLDNDKNKFTKYSRFSKYREEKDLYIFYMYEGYYQGNCKKGDNIELYDFISGEVIYKGICNGNYDFTEDPLDNIEKLQLYKYELKKNKNGSFYLYGYNPVRN